MVGQHISYQYIIEHVAKVTIIFEAYTAHECEFCQNHLTLIIPKMYQINIC